EVIDERVDAIPHFKEEVHVVALGRVLDRRPSYLAPILEFSHFDLSDNRRSHGRRFRILGLTLLGFALRADDLESEAARLRAAGFAVGEIIPGERRRQDGTLVQWKLALIEGGFAPFLIQDVTPQD